METIVNEKANSEILREVLPYYYPILTNISTKSIHTIGFDRFEVKDLIQESFISLAQKNNSTLNLLLRTGKLLAYTIGIFKYKCREMRNKKRSSSIIYIDHMVSYVDNLHTPSASRKIDIEAIIDKIIIFLNLNDAQKSICTLHFNNYSTKEIAELTRMTHNYIYVTLSRIKKKISVNSALKREVISLLNAN